MNAPPSAPGAGEAGVHPIWAGQVADGKTAALIDVSVEYTGSELVLRPLDPALAAWRWSVEGLKLEGMREQAALDIEHGGHPGMLLSLAQGEEARRVLSPHVRPSFTLPGGKHPLRYAGIVLSLVVGLAALGYWASRRCPT